MTVETLEDRLIVRTRRSALIQADAPLPFELLLKFKNSLEIEIAGPWNLTSSPKAASRGVDIPVADLIGAEVLSLVLFVTGSIRLILTGEIALTTDATSGAKVWVRQDDVFRWHAANGKVEQNEIFGQ